MNTHAAPAAPGAPPHLRRSIHPVTVWAAVGMLFVAVEVYVAVRYLTAGHLRVSTGPIGSLEGDRQALLWAAQLLVIIMIIPLVVWIVRRCVKERRMTIDALLLIGFLSQAGLDPYFSPMGMLDSATLQVPSWGRYLPFWSHFFGGPDPSVKVEPLLVTGFGYVTGLVFALTAATIMNASILRRWPGLTGTRYVMAGLGICAGIAIPIEAIWIRTGAYAYREGIPGLTLFSDQWYQVPIYFPVTSGIFWIGIAYLIRCYYLKNGPESTIFRGSHLFPRRTRAGLRILAVIGLLDLCLMLDCIAFQLFGLFPGQEARHIPLPFV